MKCLSLSLVFQENSLEEMCLKYPISSEELVTINGVGEGKAKRYGGPIYQPQSVNTLRKTRSLAQMIWWSKVQESIPH